MHLFCMICIKSEYLGCQMNSIYMKEYTVIDCFVSSLIHNCSCTGNLNCVLNSSSAHIYLKPNKEVISLCHLEIVIAQSLAAMANFTHFHYQFYNILTSIIIPLLIFLRYVYEFFFCYLSFYLSFTCVRIIFSFILPLFYVYVCPSVLPSIRPTSCLSTIL